MLSQKDESAVLAVSLLASKYNIESYIKKKPKSKHNNRKKKKKRK